MQFPHLVNLDDALLLSEPTPQAEQQPVTPLHKFEDREVLEQRCIDDAFPNRNVPNGKINFYVEMERLPRLPNGTFNVNLPQGAATIHHKRTHHPRASFDETMWKHHTEQRREGESTHYENSYLGSARLSAKAHMIIGSTTEYEKIFFPGNGKRMEYKN
ncbi:MAG: hypothetical protein OXR66_07770 [Candidatus Woesearchaeota archaeon]|nr:hypothetical protein [Candidatus Woesearchaeota archaeon]